MLTSFFSNKTLAWVKQPCFPTIVRESVVGQTSSKERFSSGRSRGSEECKPSLTSTMSRVGTSRIHSKESITLSMMMSVRIAQETSS